MLRVVPVGLPASSSPVFVASPREAVKPDLRRLADPGFWLLTCAKMSASAHVWAFDQGLPQRQHLSSASCVWRFPPADRTGIPHSERHSRTPPVLVGLATRAILIASRISGGSDVWPRMLISQRTTRGQSTVPCAVCAIWSIASSSAACGPVMARWTAVMRAARMRASCWCDAADVST